MNRQLGLSALGFSLVWTVFASAAPRAGETFLGVVEYGGGFLQEAGVKVAVQNPVKFFRVAIPQFCAGVEILEAYTTTEGIKDAAVVSDKTNHVYQVNGGAGSRIGSVLLTLNGPAAAKCTIPIYVSDTGTTIDTTGPQDAPYGNLSVCNSTGGNVWVSLAFRNGNDLMSQGWWKLASGACRVPAFTAKTLGYVYMHGYSENGRFWGHGPNFCVKQGGHFQTTQASCDQMQPGFGWQQFSEYVLTTRPLQITLTP